MSANIRKIVVHDMEARLDRNAFAILGLPPTATREEVVEAASRMPDEAALAARRALLLPRLRIDAELSYLPGCGGDHARILARIADGDPSVVKDVPPVAALNIYADWCSRDLNAAEALPGLCAAHVALDSDGAREAIARDRDAAGFPPPSLELVQTALDVLADRNAQALAEACARTAEGERQLTAMLARHASSAAFPRRIVDAWDRVTAARAAQLREAADGATEALAARPGVALAEQAAAAVVAFGRIVAPQRARDAGQGLSHALSREAAERWRRVSIKVCDDDRADAALPLARALAEAFTDMPLLGEQLQQEVTELQVLVQHARGMAPLLALIADCERDPSQLVRDLPAGSLSASSRGAAGALWQAFTRANAAEAGEAPLWALRRLAIHLHNNAKATVTALAIVRGLGTSVRSGLNGDVSRALAADRRTLERELATAEIDALLSSGRHAACAAAIDRALPLFDDGPALLKLRELRQTLYRRHRRTLLSRGFWAAVAAIVVIAVIASEPRPGTSTRSAGPVVDRGAPVALPPPAAPRPATQAAAPIPFTSHPTVRGATLSLPELRWCVFEGIRIEAARPHVSSEGQIQLFNAMVGGWNAVCSEYRYRRGDQEQVERDLSGWRAALEREGRVVVCGSSGICAGPPATVPPSPSPPPPPSPRAVDLPGATAPSWAPWVMLSRDDILLIQRRLDALGFRPGGVDGVMGPMTQRALAEFRRARGLGTDSTYDIRTRTALFAGLQEGPNAAPTGRAQPSFACTAARTPTEQLICADDDLAFWDGEMGRAYRLRLDGTAPDLRSAVTEQQREWLRARNAQCGGDAAGAPPATAPRACILDMTRRRVAALRS